MQEISEHFPKERFQTVIPRTVRLADAPSFGQTILEHGPRSPGALAYKQLAEELTARVASKWTPIPVSTETQMQTSVSPIPPT